MSYSPLQLRQTITCISTIFSGTLCSFPTQIDYWNCNGIKCNSFVREIKHIVDSELGEIFKKMKILFSSIWLRKFRLKKHPLESSLLDWPQLGQQSKISNTKKNPSRYIYVPIYGSTFKIQIVKNHISINLTSEK